MEVRDVICPRCRMRASHTQVGDGVLLQCRRCNISTNYSPISSYVALKDHVRGLILEQLDVD